MSKLSSQSNSSLGVVGSGTLAKALVPYLLERGKNIAGIWARDKASARKIANPRRIPVFDDILELVQNSKVMVLAVTDNAIGGMAERISRTSLKGRLIVHASGCLPLEILASAKLAGADIAVVHPLMTLTWRKGRPNPLHEAPLGLTCSNKKLERSLQKGFARAGHPVFHIPPESRPLYHAAAVLACAGLHQLFTTSVQLLEETGICTSKKGKKLLMPIVKQTLELELHSGDTISTGPWSRRDSQTIQLHLRALKKTYPKIFRLYACLMDLSQENKE